ncbi:patatin-like phospholipase family protein [Alcaligenaceae bacterium CGII-47]|nr:patatin-like phospholipase family protein [Alcaligenaceae bacterium CGII-47]
MNATRKPRKRESGIGLSLSGGGYRATLFHVGSLRRLAETGVLEQVSHVSSVSGGSIVAGALAADWVRHPTDDALQRIARLTDVLRKFCSHTIDTPTIIGGLLTPFRRVSDVLASKYDGALFDGLLLSQLPLDRPRFTFCSTNLQTGRLVHLTRNRIVDYRIGRTALDVPLARAVAASSAFPPFLSPVEIDTRQAKWEATTYSTLTNDKRFSQRLYLTDGGAYDNMGLEPIWDKYANILVSDAGAPFVNAERPATGWFSQLHAAFEIATDQARGARKRWLIDQFQRHEHDPADGGPKGTYWGITTQIVDYELGDALPVSRQSITQLASMRTRLDAFNDTEQKRLINWGYAVCDAGIRRWCSSLCRADTPKPIFPYPDQPLA